MIRTQENTLPSPIIQGSARTLCGKNRKRPYDKEQAIPLLSANKKLPAYGRQNPADRKNFYSNLSRHHYSRSFTHALDDALSSAILLNGGKNTLWESREKER